ncbi:TPA: hypothetical protein ACH3X1_008999 [Trebouxia sp. C0004]
MRGLQHQVFLLASSDIHIVDSAGFTARCLQARWRPSAQRCKRDAKRLARLNQSYTTAQAAVPAGIHPQRSAQNPGLICLPNRALGVLSQPSKTTCGGSVLASVRCSASAVDRFGRSSDAASDTLQRGVPAVLSNLHALYQFSRPHTMLGTFISICSVSLLAMGPGDFGSQAAIGLLQALIPALLMNICIVGTNQIFDVDIDKVNKPYLPLASGDWSLKTGISVAVGTGLVAVLLGLYIGSPPLLATLVGSLLLGIAYSVDLPFLRWKKYPVLAMGCILCVRAIMVQLGFYFHMQQVLHGSRVMLTWPLVFAMCFMLVFSIVIALFKDIPDVKGDSQADVQTLSVKLGVKRVFWACIMLLELAYAGAIGLGALSQVPWRILC